MTLPLPRFRRIAEDQTHRRPLSIHQRTSSCRWAAWVLVMRFARSIPTRRGLKSSTRPISWLVSPPTKWSRTCRSHSAIRRMCTRRVFDPVSVTQPRYRVERKGRIKALSSNGFSLKSQAPSFIASTARDGSSCPVTMTTGRIGSVAIRLRQHQTDLPTHDLGRPVAEDALGSRVERRDDAAFVDDDHAFSHRVGDGVQARLARPHLRLDPLLLLFGALVRVDVEDHAAVPDRLALLVYLHAPARAQPADLPAGMNDPVIHAVDPAGAANRRDGVGPSKSVVRIQQSFERGEIGRMRAPNPEHDRLRV